MIVFFLASHTPKEGKKYYYPMIGTITLYTVLSSKNCKMITLTNKISHTFFEYNKYNITVFIDHKWLSCYNITITTNSQLAEVLSQRNTNRAWLIQTFIQLPIQGYRPSLRKKEEDILSHVFAFKCNLKEAANEEHLFESVVNCHGTCARILCVLGFGDILRVECIFYPQVDLISRIDIFVLWV